MTKGQIFIPNLYEVTQCQWKKWSPVAQNTFNYMIHMGEAMYKSRLFHPEDATPIEHMHTIIWNMAWMAADHVEKNLLSYPETNGDKK